MHIEETEVLVVGYGGAGATAAIVAHDAGAKVLLIEKDVRPGGNTRLSGGTLREFIDTKKAAEYYQAILDTTVSRAVNRAFVDETAKNPDWMRSIGADLEKSTEGPQRFPPSPHVIWPFLPGSEGMGGRWQIKGKSRVGGTNMFEVFTKAIDQRKFKVMFKTAAKKLILNANREVTGVIADSPDGEIQINAKKAVVLTCGGFQYNEEMQYNYLGFKLMAQGCKGNTGDGIKMCQEIGADIWHMTGVSCGIGYKFPEFEAPMGIGVRTPQYIYLDQNGDRFIDETGVDVHAMAFDFTFLDHKTLKYPRIPGYLIFDDTTCSNSPMIGGCPGAIMDSYQWSSDNKAEIAKGWIKTAPTLRELAPKINLRPEKLLESVSKYNVSCLSGYDPEFNRRPETMSPLVKAPYYAVEVYPCLLNTQGGPKRNEKAQILDTNGKIIRRLYSAGELGSMFNILYPGAGNVSECLAYGRIAGRNAAAEKPIQ